MAFYVVTSNPKFYGILPEYLSDRLFVKNICSISNKNSTVYTGKKEKELELSKQGCFSYKRVAR